MSTALNGYVLFKILFSFWVWPEGLWSWTTVNYSSIGNIFFVSSDCLLFSQTGMLGLLINIRIHRPVIPFSCFFQSCLFDCESIQNRFFFSQFKDDASTLDAKSKCLLKYQQKVFKEQGSVLRARTPLSSEKIIVIISLSSLYCYISCFS